MQTLKTIVNDSETASQIDFSEELKGVPKSERESILRDIGDLLVEQTLLSLADSKSPVSGDAFKKLSPEYAKIKKDETGSTAPNLDLTGDMINSIDYEISGTKLTIGVFGSDAPKADGHNNLSGKSDLPLRQFLPKKGQSYDENILEKIDQLVTNAKVDSSELDINKLENIESKSDLYDYLSDILNTSNKAAIKEAVLSSELNILLDDYDLLKYL